MKCVDAHGVHVASAVLSTEAVKYWPAEHVVAFGRHEVTSLVPTLKCVDAQAAHVESALLSAAAVKYWPAGHEVFFNEHGP